MIEPAFADEEKFLRDRWNGSTPDVRIYGLDVTEEEILSAASAAGKAEVVVFFCYDAHLYPNERSLMNALQQASKRLIIVLMRDPYDREFLGKADTVLSIFGWRACQIEAALERIRDSKKV